MKILLINNEFPPIGGGGSILTKYVAKNLVDLGHEVYLVTSSYKDLQRREKIDGYEVHRVCAIRRFKDYCSIWELMIFFLSALLYSIFLVPRFKPDLIQAYFAVPAGGVAYFINLIYGVPYCIFLGGSDVPGANPYRYKKLYPFLSPLIKLFWRRAAAVTAASEGLAKIARSADPKRDFLVIPNGVDTEYFKPKKKNNKVIKILGVGRLMPRKGYQFVLEALPEVEKNTKRDFKLILAGGGNYQKDLLILAKKNKVEKKVEFLGQISYERLHRIFLTSDIFVHPSLAEGMPLALLEGIASGLPAITTKVPGNEDLVIDGQNGFLLPKEDVKGMAKSLIKLINSQKLRERMGKESAKIAKRYDWKEIAKEYNEVYLKIYEKTRKNKRS